MVVIFGTLACALIAAGSSLFTTGSILPGMILMSVGAGGLGMMFASFQSAAKGAAEINPKAHGLSTPGLTVGQLKHFLDDPWVDASTAVYVGDQGFNAAGGVFLCILDGSKSLVIEGKER